MAKFNTFAYLREGRLSQRAAMAALEKQDRETSTPYRTAGVNWSYLIQRTEEHCEQLEAELKLNREWISELKRKLP